MNKAIKSQNDRFVKNCLPELKKFIKQKRKQDPDYGFICNRQIENIIIFQVEQNTLDSKNIAKIKHFALTGRMPRRLQCEYEDVAKHNHWWKQKWYVIDSYFDGYSEVINVVPEDLGNIRLTHYNKR